MKKLCACAMAGIFLAVIVATAASAEVWPVKMERAGVVDRGHFELDAGLAYEEGREIQGLEYDNLRLAPLGLRYGLGESAEVGGFIAYSDNSSDDAGAPDDSGLEGISLFGKMELNQYFSLQAGVTFWGDDDIAPYANDGLDLFVNVPMQRKLGVGLLYGQFGYRAQGGDFDDTSYFNYGIGYGLPLKGNLGVNVELVGEEEQKGTSNTLDLVLGLSVMAQKGLRIAPYVSFGLYDDSPDVSVGGVLNVTF
jgi:hypothetical protein